MPDVMKFNTLNFMMQEVDELSVVEHEFTTVVLSDTDFETVCNGERVISSIHGCSTL